MTATVSHLYVIGNEVVVVWGDGHESYYPGDALRRACSCATCKGEQHLFGRATLPTLRPLRPEAFVPVAASVVGNYGLQVTWGDGHDHGIYHLDELRAACPCDACRARRGEPTA
ncbi:MAG TPA: DUF971 domain-containing protein [Thermoanaerobaculaceae bacterium]|nr:DUF971 domain-containing protein [Thermoanaerobaculaceae bacterium]